VGLAVQADKRRKENKITAQFERQREPARRAKEQTMRPPPSPGSALSNMSSQIRTPTIGRAVPKMGATSPSLDKDLRATSVTSPSPAPSLDHLQNRPVRQPERAFPMNPYTASSPTLDKGLQQMHPMSPHMFAPQPAAQQHFHPKPSPSPRAYQPNLDATSHYPTQRQDSVYPGVVSEVPAAPPRYGLSDYSGSYQHTNAPSQSPGYGDLQGISIPADPWPQQYSQPHAARAYQPSMLPAGMEEQSMMSELSPNSDQSPFGTNYGHSMWQVAAHPAECGCQACTEAFWAGRAGG
jgi:hypothetical protein